MGDALSGNLVMDVIRKKRKRKSLQDVSDSLESAGCVVRDVQVVRMKSCEKS